MKYISYRLGWVVGLDYKTDGCEWLTHKYKAGLGLCSLNINRKESDPHLFKTEEAAKKAAIEFEGSLTRSLGRVFYREYQYCSFDEQNLPKLTGPIKKVYVNNLVPEETT